MKIENKRDYEVSVWTLQDGFITVLKPYGINYKGLLQDPEMEINTDGTQLFSFGIPMYLYENNIRKENPIWYNTQNGNIIENMRKIKVIFNKKTEVEKVFEFLIIKVTEDHSGDTLYCNVECEGMAFHELGKIGYKVSLTADGFYLEDEEWFNGGKEGEQPMATLQYWNNKFLEPLPENSDEIKSNIWYYKIDMDWSQYAYGRDGQSRESNKVYEEEYSSSWTLNENNNLITSQVESFKEKERLVDLTESNVYNLTQDLAETFGVFCRYEYNYDDNYHIIGRTIIYYNNYMREQEGYLSFTYPYTSSKITREKDSVDTITKMFVRPVDDFNSASGLLTIMDVDANKTREDFLLNFDYLYQTGAIFQDQYDEIKKYEAELNRINNLLVPIEDEIVNYQNNLPTIRAALTTATNGAQLDRERITAANNLLNELDSKDGDIDGAITIGAGNPKSAILLQDSSSGNENVYYINIADKGVIPSTVRIYRTINFTKEGDRLQNELTTGTPVYDEFGNLTKISNLYGSEVSTSRRTVYLTYKYVPQLYYENIKRTWETKLLQDEADKEKAQDQLDEINAKLEAAQAQHQTYLEEKENLTEDFNQLMGPALREGYWQPEDYHDYGDRHTDSFHLADANESVSEIFADIFWDNELFDSEQKISYQILAENPEDTTQYYPCIDLSGHMDYVSENLDKLGFIFYDYLETEVYQHIPRNARCFSAGSEAVYGFVKNGNDIVPALILLGVKSMSQIDQDFIWTSAAEAQIGVLTTKVDTENHTITTEIEEGSFSAAPLKIAATEIYYPRIRIGSMSMKNTENDLFLSYDNEPINNYSDYYVLSREDGYYITIKPETLLKKENYSTASIGIMYTISNASTAVYLDAIQVLKENAFPKVSYTVDPSVFNSDFIYTIYNTLNRIVNINDVDLKLKDVQGYISKLNLRLDYPDQDQVEVKNYKTKFEDLFSSIVAQTEAMKKSAYTLNVVQGAFNNEGNLNSSILQTSLKNADLNYAFNNGTLTINDQDGIWGTSDSGVVAFRGGGIFTATEQDEYGNWIWNTGIVPQGINAALITTGQLDTSKITIYSGDRLRFQLNEDGLFAYKSFFSDQEIVQGLDSDDVSQQFADNTEQDDIDTSQYITYNENGLFLVAKSGAMVVNEDKNDFITISNDVNRVSITWDGLTLRNWNGDRVFYANADTGDLTLEGTIKAISGEIGGWTITKNYLEGSNIQLIGSDYRPETGADLIKAGIYLYKESERTPTYIIYEGERYYKYKIQDDNSSPQYYYKIQSNPPETLTVDNENLDDIYWYEVTVNGYEPRWTIEGTKTQTQIKVDDQGNTVFDENGEAVTENITVTALFIADASGNAVIKDGTTNTKIEYDGTSSNTSSWYTDLTAAQRTLYVREITAISDTLTNVDSSLIGETLEYSTYVPTFSVVAETGETTINAGTIGDFTIRNDGLYNGTLRNINLVSGTIDGATITNKFHTVVSDVYLSSASGVLSVRRIDGTQVNFNIADTAYVKDLVKIKSMSVGSWNTTTNKCTVTATTKGGGKASRTVDASSIYTNGRDSVDSATGISLVSGSVSYNSSYNTYNFTVNMTLENGKSVTRPYSGFSAGEAYNTGWNNCRNNSTSYQIKASYYQTLYYRDADDNYNSAGTYYWKGFSTNPGNLNTYVYKIPAART